MSDPLDVITEALQGARTEDDIRKAPTIILATLKAAGYRVTKQEKVVRWLSIAERDEVLWRDLA